MDKIIRCITSDGAIMASAVDASDIVFTAQRLHKTTPVATAALGRLLCAGSMMGMSLKQNNAKLTLQVNGDGPIGSVVVVSDSHGNVKGYVTNPDCPTEYYNNGKINVASGVGKYGTLGVIRDYGSRDPYVGRVPLVSGEIAEDITSYYATSEQIPTVCALGVLVDKEDERVLLAGGLLIQLLPGADDSTIDKLEKNITELEPVTTMFAKGMSILEICKTALKGFDVEVLDEEEVNYVCGCSREKIESYFMGLPEDELRECLTDNGTAEVNCQFCNKTYTFTEDDIEKIIKNKK
ncbi:MAG: Hsp33 family molecular chaperone HslO [Ruminococcus sp.]|jgi:molecular chaperone Hsp33|nr:Hsp33 family molecular chaperone HslO [Ruminococcus sp.]